MANENNLSKEELEQILSVLQSINAEWAYINSSEELSKQKIEEIKEILVEKGSLEKNEIKLLNLLSEIYEKRKDSEGEILEEIQNRLSLLDVEIQSSKVISKYQLQSLRAYQDMLSPLQKSRQIREEMLKMSEKEMQTYKVGTILKMAESLNLSFMTIVKSLSAIKAELNKITTDSASYLANVREAAEAVPGLSFEESSKSLDSLLKGFSNFTKMSEQQRTRILTITSAMDKLGFSSSNVAATMETMTKSLGASQNESIQFLSSLNDFAKKTNIPMAELDRNMSAVGSHLSKFGKDNYDKVFMSLSVAAKNLGIEIGKLLSTTEGFTTFEGAASAAGQLNAALGGNFINSINLLDAAMRNPIEAFEQIKEAMDASGRSFSDLSPSMQRYVASILNMELADAQKLFSQSLGAASAELTARAAKEKELQELAAKSTDAFKRLEVAIQKIIASPFVDYFIKVIEVFAKLLEFLASIPILSEGFGIFIGAIAATYSALVIYNGIITALTMAKLLFSRSTTKETAELLLNTNAQKLNNTSKLEGVVANEAAALSMASLGPTLLLAGLGIAAASIGFSMLAESLKGLDESGKNTLIILALIGAGVVLFVALMLKAAPAIALSSGLIWGLVGAFVALGAVMAVVIAAQAYKIKQEAELQKAQNENLKLAKDIMSIDYSFNPFQGFIAGVENLAQVIRDNKEDLKLLKELGSVNLPDTNMPKKESADSSSSSKTESKKEVTLVINSPVTLDGAPFGKMIYNGIALWKEMETREISPGELAFDNGSLSR